tara:strand:+ start:2359 stop:6705 length:4347 start_codon:yes stop_codon:yes gene_type:complete
MAKVVNTFVKGKLNKDLDARLIPNGEYRDARNVQVSKSEGPDVGELENVLGNKLTSLTFPANSKCIGYITDDTNNFIYLFTTDNTTENFIPSGAGSNHRVFQYNTLTDTFISLFAVSAFLNFSQLNPIYGINLVENLLFWTDNRNQPRKINIERAVADNRYYQKEDQISVAKYNPYQPIQLFQRSELGGNTTWNPTPTHETTMKDVTSKTTPIGLTGDASAIPAANQITIDVATAKGIVPVSGASVGYIDSSTGQIIDTGTTVAGGWPTVTTSGAHGRAIGDEIVFNANPYYNPLFAGDPAYLEDKFVRFSYRWRFDDNEYSIMSPFTQAAFIPKQDGYFMYAEQESPRLSKDDQASAYRSTIVDFVENKVDEIKLIFPLPYTKFNLQNELKIKELQILYKESDGLAVRVIDTIPVEDIYNSGGRGQFSSLTNPTTIVISNVVGNFKAGDLVYGRGVVDGTKVVSYNSTTGVLVVDTAQTVTFSTSQYFYATNPSTYEYLYNSTKPFKTLPDSELLRVFDKVPVKALAQEMSGNRVIYGNFQNKHTPPVSLDYNVQSSAKSNFKVINGKATVNAGATNIAAGTNIPVTITSGSITVGDAVFGWKLGSTGGDNNGFLIGVVTSYSAPNIQLDRSVARLNTGETLTFQDLGVDTDTTSLVEYPNSSLKQNRNYQVGIVLSDRFGRQSSVILSNNKDTITVGTSNFIGDTVYSGYIDESVNQVSFPGNSLKLLFNNPISPAQPNNQTGWPGIYNGDITSADYNPLGWYSYKIVVKQTEQDYYNVYLPGIMAAYPEDTKKEVTSTSHVVLINDNINKVPRDLNEVGPDQKQYRSSVRLFGRVQNTATAITYSNLSWGLPATNLGLSNTQYYPERTADTVSTISTMVDLFEYNPLDKPRPNYFPQFYLFESNPLIARISTENQIGQVADTNYAPASATVSATTTGTAIPITNIQGTLVPGMKVEGPNIPEDVFTNNNASPVQLIDITGAAFTATLEQNDILRFIPGFTAPNLGTLKLPGIQYLSVYETTPTVSNLDIYFETTTAGLISDLNSLILSESLGGADISSFNTSGWTEAAASGANILSSTFQVVDQFGVPLDTTNALLTQLDVELIDVTDGNNPGNSVQGTSPYFNLVQTGVLTDPTITFNIQTTTNYFNAVFFSSPINPPDPARRFNFKFRVTTTFNSVQSVVEVDRNNFGPINVQPQITTPGTSPVSTNRTNTSALTTILSHNGAANTTLRTQDYDVSITNLTKNGAAIGSEESISDYFTLSNSVVATELQSQFFIASPTIQVADYVLTLSFEDAGETIVSNYAVDLNRADKVVSYEKTIYFCDSPDNCNEQSVSRFQISGSPVAAENGYYYYAAIPCTNPDDATLQLANGTSGDNATLTIDRTNANPASGGGQGGVFYFSAVSFAAAQALYLAQPPFAGNDCGAGSGLETFVAEDISAYAVEII